MEAEQKKQKDQSDKAKKLQDSLQQVLNEHYEPSTVGAFQQNYLRQQQFNIHNGIIPSLHGLPLQNYGLKSPKDIFMCTHRDKKHYAKNMCHNCYHRKGKTKLATGCEHTDKPHYSNGKCQSCYLAEYYVRRKKQPVKVGSKRARNEDASEIEDDICQSAQREPELPIQPEDEDQADEPEVHQLKKEEQWAFCSALKK